MRSCCAPRLLRCVPARRSPCVPGTFSRLAAGRLASGARDAFHRSGPPRGDLDRGGRRFGDRSRGFSLLEVLVAFVVLAVVGTAIFQLFGGAMGNAGAASEWSRGTLIAQTQLAIAAAADPLRETTDSGEADEGRIRWETKVSPYTPTDISQDLAQASESMPIRLYRIEVAVHLPSLPGRDRVVELQTLRVGSKDGR